MTDQAVDGDTDNQDAGDRANRMQILSFFHFPLEIQSLL